MAFEFIARNGIIAQNNSTVTGSFLVSGSTTQIGNNTLTGNTTLSGSITISGSITTPVTPTIKIYGDVETNGVIKFIPVVKNIDTSISASYIFVSGSTNDLYFSQNGNGYSNVTRLRWLEGNLYTGLLNGGLITSQSSTVYQISSGSGIIVSLNASIANNPYPTVEYINWPNLSASIAPTSASYDQTFIGVQSGGTIYAQGTPFIAGQFDTLIPIGVVLHQNHSTINGLKTQPSLAYGFKQRVNIFTRAFGPLKLSGLTVAVSGSSTGSLIITSGTAYQDGANYPTDPNNTAYVTDSGTSVSKIFKYRQSGSQWVYDTNNGAGYGAIDPTKYSANGTLTAVSGSGSNKGWSIQRVFWYPQSTTKAIVVYYGNAQYGSLAEAQTNINLEPFVEAPNTSANAVFIGALVLRNDASFQVSDSYAISPGGLFRGISGTGGGGSVVTQTLSGLSDVAISGPLDHQPLAYDTTSQNWTNQSTISASLAGNALTATTASYALTASFVNGISNGTASFANTASYALTASYVSGSSSVSASYAATSSYANNFTVAGTLTAQTINVQTITSSIDFVTGSTRFGTIISNTHRFTGSVSVSGSLDVVGPVSGSSFNSVLISRGKGDDMGSIAIGTGNLASNNVGYNNTAVGNNALTANTDGSLNSGFGYNALGSNTDGSFNVAFGFGALSSNTSGGRNTAIGYNAGVGLSTPLVSGFNNIFLGSRSEGEAGSESNRTWIGNVDTTTTWLGGELLLGTRLSSGGVYRATIIGNTRISGSLITTGSIISTLGFTGSLLGTATTASYVVQAQSASYWSGSIINAATASYVVQAQSASYWSGSVINAATASYALTASYVSGSSSVSASYAATSSYADNFTVGNTLTAQRIVVQTISSSIEFASGSNRFGSLLTDTQTFTGSVGITGSLTVNGDQTLSGSLNIVPLSGNKGIVVTANAGTNGVIQQGQSGSYTFTIDGANGGGPRLGLGSSPSAGYNYFQIGAYSGENNFDSVTRNFSIRSTISAVNDTRFKLFYNTGNAVFQNGGTFTDNGYRLQVSGSSSGSLYVNGLSTFDGIISGSYTPNNPSSSLIILSGSITPSASLGGTSAMYVNTVLSASANSQTLVGLDIAPSFNNGSFTGIQQESLVIRGGTNTVLRLKNTAGTTTYGQIVGTPSQLSINAQANTLSFVAGNVETVNIFSSTRNVSIQNGGTFTDAGYRLDVSGSTRLNGPTTIVSASLDYQQNLAVATGSFQTITSVATGSFRSAFFDYVAFSGSIVRAGTLVSTWSGSNTEFYENFTGDLGGSTAVVTLQTAISASNIVLQAGISGSAWSVRSLVRLL
jgi:hypothetical protein